MFDISKSSTRYFVFAVFLIGCLSSVIFSYYKLAALSYHTHDFSFYLQFSAKLFDDQLTPRFSISPDGGYNIFHLFGTDGERSLYQSIHFEPIKYLEALLFAVTKTPLILFIFIAVVYFLPIFYIYKNFSSPSSRINNLFIIIISLLYLSYPSVLPAVSFDLRPYIFLSPFFFLSFLSIYFNKKLNEIMFFFNLMFLAREEAVYFGLINIIYAYFKYREGFFTKKLVFSLAASLFFWIIAMLIYFQWTGYAAGGMPTSEKIKTLANVLYGSKLIIASLLLILSITIGIFFKKLKKAIKNTPKELVLFVMAPIPLLLKFIMNFRSYSLDDKVKIFFYYPRWIIFLFFLLIILFIVWEKFNNHLFKKYLLVVVSLFFLTSFSLNFLNIKDTSYYIKGSSYSLFTKYLGEIKYSSLVWDFASTKNRYKEHILSDFYTQQAFYDYENIYVYNSLPTHLIIGKQRLYPKNLDFLSSLLRKKIEYVVISKGSVGDIQKAALNVGVNLNIESENELYIIYKIG